VIASTTWQALLTALGAAGGFSFAVTHFEPVGPIALTVTYLGKPAERLALAPPPQSGDAELAARRCEALGGVPVQGATQLSASCLDRARLLSEDALTFWIADRNEMVARCEERGGMEALSLWPHRAVCLR
jgi:hypothetical protein